MIHRIHVTSFGIGCPQKIQVETIRNPKARNQKGVGIASLGFPFFEFEWIDWDLPRIVFFPNSNSFGVFSYSKGFGAELLSDSLWFSGADRSWVAKRPRGRFDQGSSNFVFHQGSAKVPPRLRKFRDLSVFWGRSVLGCQKVPWRVPPSLL